jgi:glycine/D-amino acid oxidase-like deaminating enzyme
MKSQLFLSGYISFLLIVLTSCNTQSVPLTDFPENENMVFFNGLGTRGLMQAPYLSEILFDFLENKQPIPKEFDLKRML